MAQTDNYVTHMLIFWSKYSPKCIDIFNRLDDLNDQWRAQFTLVNCDSRKIRYRVSSKIKSVPCLMIVFDNGQANVFLGENFYQVVYNLLSDALSSNDLDQGLDDNLDTSDNFDADDQRRSSINTTAHIPNVQRPLAGYEDQDHHSDNVFQTAPPGPEFVDGLDRGKPRDLRQNLSDMAAQMQEERDNLIDKGEQRKKAFSGVGL